MNPNPADPTRPNPASGSPATACEPTAYIGIDWADGQHALAWRHADQTTWHEQTLEHTPEALATWAAHLARQFGGRPVAVCLEQSRGPLVYALSGYPWIVLYPINPKSLARYREALYPSGAKDDPSDARLLGQFLSEHRARLRPWKCEDADTRRLRTLLQQREKLVDQRTAFVNQLIATLKTYHPQALDWAGSLTKPVAWDFLLRWPTLADVQKATGAQLLRFFYAHGVRRGDKLQNLAEEIRAAVPLHQDLALIEPAVAMVQALCKLLRALGPSIRAHEQAIAKLYAAHPDRVIFQSVPGAGAVLEPRLLVAFGEDRDRWENALGVAQLSGIAPVLERSGQSEWVHWRWSADSFLRQSFHEFAACSRRWCVWARAYYEWMVQRGNEHHAAVRALAFKWIRVLYRCWKERVPYDETRYIEALRRRGSPLVERIERLKAKGQQAA